VADNRISIGMTLEGAERAKAQMEDFGKAAERVAKQVQSSGKGIDLDSIGRAAHEQLEKTGLRYIENQTGLSRLREILHTLHPILDATGAHFGGLTAFMGASRAGAVGLAAALAGTLGVELLNIEAQAKQTALALKGVYGDKGGEALKQAQQGASEVGRSTGEFAGQMQALQHLQYLRGPSPEAGGMIFPERSQETGQTWKPEPGSAVEKLYAQNLSSLEGQRFFTENLDKLIRGTGATPDASKKAIDTLIGEWTKQAEAGKPTTLTPEAVKAIYAASPEAARRIAGSLGAIGANGMPSAEQLQLMTGSGYVWGPEQVAGAVAQLAPDAQKEFLRRPQGASERISTATNAATSVAERMVVPPPEALASQQGAYQRYLEARRGYATQPSTGAPGGPAAPFKADFSQFESAVHEFGSWVASLVQKNPAALSPEVAARVKAEMATWPLPDYFPQGRGSGLVTSPGSQGSTAAPPLVPPGSQGSTAAPPLVPSGGQQTAVVYYDKKGNPVVVPPGKPLPGFADGGDVPGIGASDTVHAMLTPGEHVVDRFTMQQPGVRQAIRQMEGGRYDLSGLTGGKGIDLSGLRQGGDIDFGISSPRMPMPTVSQQGPSSAEPGGVFHFHAADGRVTRGRVSGAALIDALSREAVSQKEDRAMISPSWDGA